MHTGSIADKEKNPSQLKLDCRCKLVALSLHLNVPKSQLVRPSIGVNAFASEIKKSVLVKIDLEDRYTA